MPRIAFELTLIGKLNSPLTAVIIKRMFADTRRHSSGSQRGDNPPFVPTSGS